MVEDIGSLRFGVEKPKIKWGTYLRDVMRGGSASSQFESYSGKGPSVVVRNVHGEKRVLVVTTTVEEARERVSAIKNDYKRLSSADWCERYNVPTSFIAG
jgi:hypothetical protein